MADAYVAAGADDLARTEVRVVGLPKGEDNRPREALVLRDQGGELRVYLNLCQHLPVPLDGGSRRFLSRDGAHLECGTHGARYRLDDGYCVDGPCEGEQLAQVAFEVIGGQIRLRLDE